MFDVICGQPTENITELRIPTVYEKYVTYTLLDFVGMGKKKLIRCVTLPIDGI